MPAQVVTFLGTEEAASREVLEKSVVEEEECGRRVSENVQECWSEVFVLHACSE